MKENADDLELLFQLASHKVVQSEFSEVLDILLHIIAKDYAWRDGVASLCVRGLFIMLGKDNPVTIEYRQKLIDQQST